MHRTNIILRLAIACFVAAALLYTLDMVAPESLPDARRKDRLLKAPLRDTDYIRIELSNARQIELTAETGRWHINAKGGRQPALAPAVQRLLDAFEQAPQLSHFDARDIQRLELTYDDFGLRTPAGSIILGGKRLKHRIDIGGYDTFTNALFVKFESGPDVFATTPALRDFLDLSELDFIDRHVFHANMSLVHTVVLRRPDLGDIKLVRDVGRRQWNITQPRTMRADWDAVDGLFDVLASAAAIRIVPENMRAAAALAQETAPSIQLFSQNDLVGEKLTLGGRVPDGSDQYFAQTQGGAIVVVTGALWRAAMAPVTALRDHRVFPSAASIRSLTLDAPPATLALRCDDAGAWSLTAPVSDDAEPKAVEELVNAVLALSAESFAAYSPETVGERVASVALTTRDRRVALQIFAPAWDAGVRPLMAVRPEDDDTLFLVPAATISNLLARCRDPRPLLSRTVLALAPADVHAVTLSRAGLPDERIARGANGWTAAAPGREADPAAVRRLFDALADLRAESVASLTPSNAPTLAGGAELAFDLADGDALRRILAIGPRTGEGHFARVQGHDAVFLLAPDTAALLTRPLLVPESLPAPSPPIPAETDPQ